MKLPGWRASMATGFITATFQLGVRLTLCSPLSVFSVIRLGDRAVILPRTTVGPGGVAGLAAGVWAATAPAESESAASAHRAIRVMSERSFVRVFGRRRFGSRPSRRRSGGDIWGGAAG